MKIKDCFSQMNTVRARIGWLPALISRITLGWVFIESGWGKVWHLPKVVEFFTSLGIFAPQIQAPFVAGVELIGGILLFLGLFTRFACVPLIATMVVAIVTAKRESIESFSDLLGLSEYLYIVLFLWLIVEGAGKISVDQLLKNRCVR